MRNFALPVLLVTLLTGCSHAPDSDVVKRPGEPPFVKSAADDPELLAAEARAKKELDSFIARLTAPKQDEHFAIKIALPTPDGSFEHIWVADVTYSGGKFQGVIANEPVNLPDYKVDSKVTVDKAKVEDWMIEKNGKFEGGYTADALAARAGEEKLPR